MFEKCKLQLCTTMIPFIVFIKLVWNYPPLPSTTHLTLENKLFFTGSPVHLAPLHVPSHWRQSCLTVHLIGALAMATRRASAYALYYDELWACAGALAMAASRMPACMPCPTWSCRPACAPPVCWLSHVLLSWWRCSSSSAAQLVERASVAPPWRPCGTAGRQGPGWASDAFSLCYLSFVAST